MSKKGTLEGMVAQLLGENDWEFHTIERKNNLISLYLAAFIIIFVCNLVHTDKFHGNLKPPDNFLKILDNLETNHQLISPPSFKDIENKEGN